MVTLHPTFAPAPAPRRRRSSAGVAHASDAAAFAASAAAARTRRYSLTREQRTWVDDALDRPQTVLAVIIGAVFVLGTLLSLYFDSSLSTSEIHAVHNSGIERAAYFARKRNPINVFFVKRAWAWTMALYLLHLFTTPVRPAHTPSETAVPGRVNPALHVASPHTRGSRAQRLAVLVLASLAWILFTNWCFGAGLGDRIIAASGGQCSVPLPRGIGVTDLAPLLAGCPADKPPTECPAIPDPDGAFSLDRLASAGEVLYLPLPEKYCLRVPLSPTTHPLLFGAMKATHHLHEDVHAALRLPPPRWSGGFDISGHAFLLSLASLILAAEVAPSWKAYRARGYRQRAGAPARLHAAATLLATTLIGLWVWMLFMTAVYFHDPQEKFAGLALGFVTAAIVHLVRPQHTGPVIEFKVRGPTRRPSPAPIPHAEPVHPFDASEVEREKSQ